MNLSSSIKKIVGFTQLLVAKLRNKVNYLYNLYIKKDFFTVENKRWFDDRGDEDLRLNYPSLTPDSIVFDLGGFIGDFAEKIYQKYGCHVYVFEPHPVFFKKCVERFKTNKKIVVLNYGIANQSDKLELTDCGDGSSFFSGKRKATDMINCQLREVFAVLNELHISRINLMKINIEGAEYPLLEYLAAHEKLDIVDQYQIQFHKFVDGAIPRREKLSEDLSKTHQRTWCYEFVWENWQLK